LAVAGRCTQKVNGLSGGNGLLTRPNERLQRPYRRIQAKSLLLSCPGLLLAQTRLPSGASSGQAPSPWSTMPGRHQWRRSPVRVQHAVSTCPVRRPGLGCPPRPVSAPSGVQSPGFVVGDPAVRPSAVHPSNVRPSAVHPSTSGRLVSAPSVRTRPSGPHQAWRLGTGRRGRRAERPVAAAARGHGSRPQREVAARAVWLPSS
jgi:hypothetical protein